VCYNGGMFFNPDISTLIARLVVLLIAMPVHEWAHAWSAYELGDDTASLQGRLTLNPLAHLDPIGSLLILLGGFGWAHPVPVNPYRMRGSPRAGMALSAAAGPIANVLVAALCAIPFRLGLLSLADAFASASAFNPARLLYLIAETSLGLGIFNLLPFFPLDGEKVAVGLLPPRWSNRLLDFRPYSTYALIGLLFLPRLVGLDPIGWLIGLIMAPALVLFFFL